MVLRPLVSVWVNAVLSAAPGRVWFRNRILT